jgi:hypothetical protein
LAGNDAPAPLNLVLAETLVPGTLVPAAMATAEVKTKAFLAMFIDFMN